MKLQAKIPTSLKSMTLEQLVSYSNVMECVQGLKGSPIVQTPSLLDDICVIAFGTPKMSQLVSQVDYERILSAVLVASNNIFDEYKNIHKGVDYIPSFRLNVNDNNRVKIVTFNIKINIEQLPSILWAEIISKTDMIKENSRLSEEIINIPFVLSRIAWDNEEDILTKDIHDEVVINRHSIEKKYMDFRDMNALDAVRAYVFFLIVRGVYLTAPSFLYSRKQFLIRISNLRERVRNIQKDGDGLDLSKMLSQIMMNDFSNKN